jgi:tetratricopeptide (TPR) repeat protein
LSALSHTESAEAHYKRGVCLQNLGNYDHALKAFDAAIALNPSYAEAYNYRGIVLVILERHHDALTSFNKAVALKPDYAECHNNLGIVLQDLGHFDEALASFDRAIALKPDNARAHNNRGAALSDLRRIDDALISYEEAIALDPSYAEAFYNRGMVMHDAKRFDHALASYDKAIALRPDYAEAHHNRGAVLQDLLRLDDAIGAYDKAIKLRPERAESYANQSYCYLQMGRFENGWPLHEWRKRLQTPVGARAFAQPLWLGQEDISNKTLFVHWEQGFGDTIQFCRYGKLLKAVGTDVVMSVQEPLYQLLTQMSPEIGIINQTEVPKSFDYHCPMMSLPLALATTLTTIPAERRYIFSNERLRQTWDARLPAKTKPRVGVAWRGSATHKNDRHRSLDLDVLAALFSADAHWVSLQYSSGHPEEASFGPLDLVSYAGMWKDFADAAALIDCLDLVITVDTSVAHLAGAMGKPVWILLPFNSDWRWLLHRDDSPWYPSARLFRQKPSESWEHVISRVRAAFLEFIQSRS